MTPDQFLAAMKDLHDAYGDTDPEALHCDVDQLLTQTLRDLGYGEGLDYDSLQTKRRWYA